MWYKEKGGTHLEAPIETFLFNSPGVVGNHNWDQPDRLLGLEFVKAYFRPVGVTRAFIYLKGLVLASVLQPQIVLIAARESR